MFLYLGTPVRDVTPSSAPSKTQSSAPLKGMNDILPAAVTAHRKLPSSSAGGGSNPCARCWRAGYQYLLTPVVEAHGLFVRGLGEVTDIVEGCTPSPMP